MYWRLVPAENWRLNDSQLFPLAPDVLRCSICIYVCKVTQTHARERTQNYTTVEIHLLKAINPSFFLFLFFFFLYFFGRESWRCRMDYKFHPVAIVRTEIWPRGYRYNYLGQPTNIIKSQLRNAVKLLSKRTNIIVLRELLKLTTCFGNVHF